MPKIIVASKPYNNRMARIIFPSSKVNLSAYNYAGLTGLHLLTQGIGAAEFQRSEKILLCTQGPAARTANGDQKLLADLRFPRRSRLSPHHDSQPQGAEDLLLASRGRGTAGRNLISLRQKGEFSLYASKEKGRFLRAAQQADNVQRALKREVASGRDLMAEAVRHW
jgi:hypothetical protein